MSDIIEEPVELVEYRLPIQMDVVGRGETEAEAITDAQTQYVAIVTSLCTAYKFGGPVVSPPSDAMVTFARSKIRDYLASVVSGEMRKAAIAAAEAAASAPGIVFE